MSIISLLEYGRHYFGGYGNSFFRRAHHADIASALRYMGVPKVAQNHIIDFFTYALRRDNPSFDAAKFKETIDASDRYGSGYNRPVYEMRHFYYFARVISERPEQEREWLAWFLRDFFSNRNGNFKSGVWFKECGVSFSGETN